MFHLTRLTDFARSPPRAPPPSRDQSHAPSLFVALTRLPPAHAWLASQGEVRKNWKKRFMVVLNEADNYEARLFENEVEAPFDRKKVKGTGIINFASRRVSRLRASDDDDVKVFESLKRPKESHILRIAPYWKWDQRRTLRKVICGHY